MQVRTENSNDLLRIVFEMQRSEAYTMTMTTVVSRVVDKMSDELFKEIYANLKCDALRHLSSEFVLGKIQEEVVKKLVKSLLKENP